MRLANLAAVLRHRTGAVTGGAKGPLAPCPPSNQNIENNPMHSKMALILLMNFYSKNQRPEQ
jgi:hypothetical protein